MSNLKSKTSKTRKIVLFPSIQAISVHIFPIELDKKKKKKNCTSVS